MGGHAAAVVSQKRVPFGPSRRCLPLTLEGIIATIRYRAGPPGASARGRRRYSTASPQAASTLPRRRTPSLRSCDSVDGRRVDDQKDKRPEKDRIRKVGRDRTKQDKSDGKRPCRRIHGAAVPRLRREVVAQAPNTIRPTPMSKGAIDGARTASRHGKHRAGQQATRPGEAPQARGGRAVAERTGA